MAKAKKTPAQNATVNIKAEATLRNRIARLERHIKAQPGDTAAPAALAKVKSAGIAGASRRAKYSAKGKSKIDRAAQMFASRIRKMNNVFKFHQKDAAEGLVIGGKFLAKADIIKFAK